MGFGAKPQGPSKAQQRNEKLQTELLQKQLAASTEPLALPNIQLPKPAPPPPPPAMQTSADVVAAEQDARRKAARRTNAGRGTIFAGETGSMKTTSPTTLLG